MCFVWRCVLVFVLCTYASIYACRHWCKFVYACMRVCMHVFLHTTIYAHATHAHLDILTVNIYTYIYRLFYIKL